MSVNQGQTQGKVKIPSFYTLRPVMKETKPRRVSPSVYSQEMLQSTEERFANTREVHPPRILKLLDMSKTTHYKISTVDMDQALFQPYPSELFFQNFIPTHIYKLQLRLLNMDKVPRQVKVEFHESEYFSVLTPEHSANKVAPSQSVTFTVFFKPQEKKDYHHSLVFVTDREKFEVPVRAIGPRAVLNFRDELKFLPCLVKDTGERTQQVINVGDSPARFELHTQEPFSVTPSCGTLEVGESVQVIVNFNPQNKGDYKKDLLLHYHTGDDVHISLHGVCQELDIHLEPDFITLSKTYITLANVHKVSLNNTSDNVLHYSWSVWPSQEEENLSLMRNSSVLQQMKEEDREEWLFQYRSDPTSINRHPLLAKALQYGRAQAEPDPLTLSHGCISLEPATGKIWPNMDQTFTIFFQPKKAKSYQDTVYCDITGRKSRLPLAFKGDGLAPKVQPSYNLMNMKNVFIGDRNCYEILLSNKGLIEAPFKLSSPATPFGRYFSFSPEEAVIPFGVHQTVKIIFQSRNLGPFSEDLILTLKGKPKPIILTFRGCVIGPTFHFNVPELNFGDVAFGFPQTLTCTLFNTSFVPMNFTLHVPGDGLGPPSITSARQVSDMSKYKWSGCTTSDPHARPMEFTISPAADCVSAMSDVTIRVTLCSNTVRTYRLAMAVDVEGVGEEIKCLPIYARCVVPEIVVETPVLQFQRCFLNYPYEQQLHLTNPSNLPACYGVLDQDYEASQPLVYFCSKPRGVILPQMSEKFSVTILTKTTGWLNYPLCIAAFGSTQSPLEVILSCIGQGPLIHIQSLQLDFGKIPVLMDITKTLQLSNQSPITAKFTATMSNQKSFWRVEPIEGEVLPQSQLELRVIAHLKDTIKIKDELNLCIHESDKHVIPLSAKGTGTSIVSDKPFAPSLDLGTHFSHGSCIYPFVFTNRGQRTHWMYWSVDGFPSNKRTRTGFNSSIPHRKDGQSRVSSAACKKEEPVFSLTPSRVKLLPGCSVDMVLMGYSDTAKVVQERHICRAVVGEQGCNEQIMSVEIICRFVAPLLSLSSRQLDFCIGKVPGEDLKPIYENLVMKNISSLSLPMTLTLVEPFSLSEATETSLVTDLSMVLEDHKQAELWISFHPEYCRDRVSRVVDKCLKISYYGHPQKDTVQLHAEIHFPNLSFSSTTVDFGCVLNYTERHNMILMTNCSQLPVTYLWAFLDDQKYDTNKETDVEVDKAEPKNPEEETEVETAEKTDLSRPPFPDCPDPADPMPHAHELQITQYPVRVEEVFDILPMHGHLEPGEQQIVTFSFYGHENISREVVAQCHVEKGPTYEIKLRGEASIIKYSIKPAHILDGER